MVNRTLCLALARLRDSFVAHSHAMPISTLLIEDLCAIGMKAPRFQAIGGSSVPISRGSPPLSSR
jgi:hypothetical protein